MAQNYCSYNLPLEASNIILHKMESIYTQTIASRGWHVYGKTSWKNPKKGQTVFAEKEQEKIALLSDPYAVAWKLKHSEKLTASVVGHVPRESSRAVSFFLDRGGIVQGTVINEKYQPSPIPRGGLEILLKVTMKIGDEKRRYLNRLREIMKANYEIGTEMECEISTASISSFEIASSECVENREELVMFLENDENEEEQWENADEGRKEQCEIICLDD